MNDWGNVLSIKPRIYEKLLNKINGLFFSGGTHPSALNSQFIGGTNEVKGFFVPRRDQWMKCQKTTIISKGLRPYVPFLSVPLSSRRDGLSLLSCVTGKDWMIKTPGSIYFFKIRVMFILLCFRLKRKKIYLLKQLKFSNMKKLLTAVEGTKQSCKQ